MYPKDRPITLQWHEGACKVLTLILKFNRIVLCLLHLQNYST